MDALSVLIMDIKAVQDMGYDNLRIRMSPRFLQKIQETEPEFDETLKVYGCRIVMDETVASYIVEARDFARVPNVM